MFYQWDFEVLHLPLDYLPWIGFKLTRNLYSLYINAFYLIVVVSYFNIKNSYERQSLQETHLFGPAQYIIRKKLTKMRFITFVNLFEVGVLSYWN